ncbi:MAG: patatin-like phospholipase family protein [Anaerolineae bacterium]|nr:patatin-like phospholipase family protein [Anaerolineae bacterium]
MREIPQLQKKPGIALVLSGGATKGFYFHLGVLKALGTHNISSIVGSSAGAVMGAFIASGASIETMLTSLHQKQVYLPKYDTWVKTLTSTMLFKPQYVGIMRQLLLTSFNSLKFVASLPHIYNKDIIAELIDTLIASQSHATSIFDSVALENLFRSLLPTANFTETEIDLYVTATGLDSCKRAVFNGIYDFEDPENMFMLDVPIHKAVRASASIPGLFEPIKIKGQYYIDGEIKQTLSADVGIMLSDDVVISHTYQPLRLTSGSVYDMGWVNIIKQSTNMILHERINVWRRIYEQQNPGKHLIWIEPEPDDVEFFLAPEFSFRPEVQQTLIDRGEQATIKALELAAKKRG